MKKNDGTPNAMTTEERTQPATSLLRANDDTHRTRSKSHNSLSRLKLITKAASEDISHEHHMSMNHELLKRRESENLSVSERLYKRRKSVLHRLSHGKNKKDVLSELNGAIIKVEEKLNFYVGNLASLKNELTQVIENMDKELSAWENMNDFNLSNSCRSYYSNLKLLIELRIEIAIKYCECVRDKHRQLKKTLNLIKKDFKKYSLDDLSLFW